MTVKERILTIRLLEKAQKHPMYAKALGIEAANAATITEPKASQ